jgi:predicted RNA-binding protein associated with RNAse of E/G family
VVYEQRLLHEAEDLCVTLLERVPLTRPKQLNGRTILEPNASIVWFTFPGQMHDLGRFHLGNETFTGFYANVIMPVTFSSRHTWHITDLYLDIWLGLGQTFEVLDTEDLDEAVVRGVLEADTKVAAWNEVERLRMAWQQGLWPPPVVHEWTLARVGGER